MVGTTTLLGKIRHRAKRLLGVAVPEFYPQVPSCQIAELSYLLELFLGRRSDGVFVEVGAYDGHSYSNTWGLATRGWRGVMVEPVPAFADQARKSHRNHPNVLVVQAAVGATEGTLDLVQSGPFTSANPGLNREYQDLPWARGVVGDKSICVPMCTLTQLLTAELPELEIDLLVVDVEGYERDVFAGFDWAAQPKILIVELHETHKDLRTTRASDALLQREIMRRGYEIAFKDSINTVFVRNDVWEAAMLG